MFAVTGATGTIGTLVAEHLAGAGERQRLVVRHPTRAPELPGATAVRTDYTEPGSLRRAFEHCEALMFVSAHEAPGRVDLHRGIVEAARDVGVKRVVYTSFQGASPTCTFTYGRDHFATEELIRSSGMEYTFLRDNFYLGAVARWVGADGVIRGPAGAGRLAAVAQDDVAACAAAALLDGGHAGITYDLTGPEAVTMDEAAEIVSRVSGKAVRFHDETEEEAYESRAHYGAEPFMVEGWVSTYLAIARGELDQVSDAVARITGERPVSLEQYLHAHPESYAHVTG